MQEKIDSTHDAGLHSLLTLEPVQTRERIELLDVIRGFALLGIVIANMAWYSSPALYADMLGRNMWTGLWDTTTSSFINLFIQGKFYSMFSFLFGLGFAIFFERAKERTTKPKLLFYRRLFILLLIGLAHAFFIWYGDILVTYALLGFLLPLFFNLTPKALIRWTISLFSIFLFFLAFMMGLIALGKMFNEGVVNDSLQPFYADMESRMESAFHVYGQGSFSEIMTQRTSDTLFSYSSIFASLFVILPLFLLGLYAGGKKIFQHMEANLILIRKNWKWGLVIGLTMSIVKFIGKYLMGADYFSFYTVIHTGAGFLGDTGLCFFYMTSMILLFQNRKWKLKLKPFSYMGRMALSNYLFQSIVCTTIFYNYGLGLYGKVGPALGLLLSIAIFTTQLIISKYWLRYYQFGPIEWLWKSLTYGKLFPMKLPET